ncbi:unnamed protein product, partial [Onchocerca flexuosa]|uniref:Apt1 domain-containing protein n=1 Tax=Onchocerca flexuosa TaxID=387005 RepID=A0A183HAB5_9BILA
FFKSKPCLLLVSFRKDAFLTEKQLKQLYFDERLQPVEEVFRGIDEHLVLVYHIVQKRIPASFGAKKDGIVPKNPGKEKNNDNDNDQQTYHQQSKDADEIFDDPLQEEIIGTRKSSSIHRSKRRGKRNHPRGNFRGNLRTPARNKRLKFIDFDAPQISQAL